MTKEPRKTLSIPEPSQEAADAYAVLEQTLDVQMRAWPLVAASLTTLQETDEWKLYAGAGESWGEFLAQLPGPPMGKGKAQKLIALHKVFRLREGIDTDKLGRVDWSLLHVTIAAVRAGTKTGLEALADAEANIKSELEAEYRRVVSGEGAGGFSADDEPPKCKCVACGHVHTAKAA